jgi:histone deacetylase complex regulatory component SIN3
MTFPDGTQLEYVDYGAPYDEGVPFDPDFSGGSPPPSGSKRPADGPFDEEDEPAKWYRQVDYEDALNYCSRVEAEVPALHQQFLELLMEFKAQSIDRPHVIERVRQLFHGHDDLILAFNVFLPLGHHLQVRCATTAGAVPDVPFQCPHTHTNL